MFGSSKKPLDRFPYPQDSGSRRLSIQEVTGCYVFIVDVDEVIHVVLNASHMHPKVLGNTTETLYAGEIEIDTPGNIVEVNNLSGTFRFKSQKSLCCVKDQLVKLGFTVTSVFWHSPAGTRPTLLLCK